MNISPYAKAAVAGGVALCGALGTALADGHVTLVEGCGIVAATLVAVGAVWRVPNKS
jgi:hypothetical protein